MDRPEKDLELGSLHGIPCENTRLHGGLIRQEAQNCGEEQRQSESDQHKGQPAHESEIHARL